MCWWGFLLPKEFIILSISPGDWRGTGNRKAAALHLVTEISKDGRWYSIACRKGEKAVRYAATRDLPRCVRCEHKAAGRAIANNSEEYL